VLMHNHEVGNDLVVFNVKARTDISGQTVGSQDNQEGECRQEGESRGGVKTTKRGNAPERGCDQRNRNTWGMTHHLPIVKGRSKNEMTQEL